MTHKIELDFVREKRKSRKRVWCSQRQCHFFLFDTPLILRAKGKEGDWEIVATWGTETRRVAPRLCISAPYRHLAFAMKDNQLNVLTAYASDIRAIASFLRGICLKLWRLMCTVVLACRRRITQATTPVVPLTWAPGVPQTFVTMLE